MRDVYTRLRKSQPAASTKPAAQANATAIPDLESDDWRGAVKRPIGSAFRGPSSGPFQPQEYHRIPPTIETGRDEPPLNRGPMNLHGMAWTGMRGITAGSARFPNAAVGDLVKLDLRVMAFGMAFGSGVLLSALSFDLMARAYRRGVQFSKPLEAILAIADTIISEAFDEARGWAGLVTASGFLAAFIPAELGG